MKPFTLAIDDADSGAGGCTTHLLGLLLAMLRDKIELADYPLLVRLAPGVPWKTRGNAAVVLRGHYRGEPRDLLEKAYRLAREYSAGRPGEPGKGPGVALYPGIEPWRDEGLLRLYREAVRGLIHWKAAQTVTSRAGVETLGGRGRLGAAAALAALGPGEPYTYELIAYRRPEAWGRDRCVRHDPMLEAGIPPCAFNNVDLLSRTLVAAPHGPDPVLAGFRGYCRGALGCYAIFLCEEPHFWILYRSNQHTDAHLAEPLKGRPYESGATALVLNDRPARSAGGHVIARARFDSLRLAVAAYRETGPMRSVIEGLAPGSSLVVGGTLHPRSRGLTLSVEKVYSVRAGLETVRMAPRCPRCGRRMKSMGRGKGYRCVSCGYRDPSLEPVTLSLPPRTGGGPASPPPSAISHLAKPHYVYRLPRQPPPPPSIVDVLSLGPDPPEGTRTLCR